MSVAYGVLWHFTLYQVSMPQTVLIFPRCILFTKIIKRFWSRDVSSIRSIITFRTISILHAPISSNISKIYILHKRNRKKLPGGVRKFWAQTVSIENFIKFFEINQVFMYQNESILPYCILLTHTKFITQYNLLLLLCFSSAIHLSFFQVLIHYTVSLLKTFPDKIFHHHHKCMLLI